MTTTTSLNRLSKISLEYPARGTDIYNYVEIEVSKPGVNPIIHIASSPTAPDVDNTVGVVLCNFGDSLARRQANEKALRWNLVSKPKPYMVIVDAQDEGLPFYYEHFADNGRVFSLTKTITLASKGIFLKELLWTLGARFLMDKNLGITKLCFMDMDTEFVDQMWVTEVAKALNTYDCISPHMVSYYAEDKGTMPTGLMASVGYNQTLTTKRPGFQGMAFACTTNFYTTRLGSEIKLSTIGYGDSYLWYDIAGLSAIHISANSFVNRHNPPRDRSGMLPTPKIGHAHQILAHRDHGPKNTRIYQQRQSISKRCSYKNFDDYSYAEDGMPIWSDTPQGRLMSKVYPNIMAKAATTAPYTMQEAMDVYEQEAVEEYGPITPSYPLVVTCILRSGGIFTGRHVRWLKKQFECKCKTPHTFICISDVKIDGVTTVPLELTKKQAPGSSGQIEQYKNIWPANASILTCDIDTVLCRPFIAHRCPEDQFAMLREFDLWPRSQNTLWGSGLTYFRGNYSFLYDEYVTHINSVDTHKPRYICMGTQEFLVAMLRKHGIEPTTIEPHFCCRYWDISTKIVPPETSMLIFPAAPKPWDIKNCGLIPKLEDC